MTQILLKVVFTAAVVLAATAIGRRMPSAAGLIGVMPLTGAMVLVWTYVDNRGNPEVMQTFTRGAFWGILPTMLFFLVAFLGFRRHNSLPVVLSVAFSAWLCAAYLHHRLLR